MCFFIVCRFILFFELSGAAPKENLLNIQNTLANTTEKILKTCGEIANKKSIQAYKWQF